MDLFFNLPDTYTAAVEAARSKSKVTPLSSSGEIYEQFVLAEYRICYPDLSDEETQRRVSEAFEAARAMCPDFDALGVLMAESSFFVRPMLGNITIAQHLDVLYTVAKHAICTRDARNAALAAHSRELLGIVQ